MREKKDSWIPLRQTTPPPPLFIWWSRVFECPTVPSLSVEVLVGNHGWCGAPHITSRLLIEISRPVLVRVLYLSSWHLTTYQTTFLSLFQVLPTSVCMRTFPPSHTSRIYDVIPPPERRHPFRPRTMFLPTPVYFKILVVTTVTTLSSLLKSPFLWSIL